MVPLPDASTPTRTAVTVATGEVLHFGLMPWSTSPVDQLNKLTRTEQIICGSAILLFIASFPPMRCGIGDYLSRLAPALRAAGHDTTVVTSTATEGGAGVLAPTIRYGINEGKVRSRIRARRPGQA